MEPVDIVSDENKVLYQTTKSKAHNNGLLHRTVIAEIVNSKGERLLVKQAGNRQDPGQYVSPVGGHVQAGETGLQALKREALEETGIYVKKYKYIGKVIFNRIICNRKENHYFIVYEIYSDEKPILNHESVSCRWFSIKELKKHIKNKPAMFGGAFFPIIEAFYPNLLP